MLALATAVVTLAVVFATAVAFDLKGSLGAAVTWSRDLLQSLDAAVDTLQCLATWSQDMQHTNKQILETLTEVLETTRKIHTATLEVERTANEIDCELENQTEYLANLRGLQQVTWEGLKQVKEALWDHQESMREMLENAIWRSWQPQ